MELKQAMQEKTQHQGFSRRTRVGAILLKSVALANPSPSRR